MKLFSTDFKIDTTKITELLKLHFADNKFCNKIKIASNYAVIKNRYGVPLNRCLKSYKHETFKIQTLSDFIEIVELIQKCKVSGKVLAYRGNANYRYLLTPSIARNSSYTVSTECNMIKEFLALRPDDFSSARTDFDLLSHMQHYGLPTRLLDFTKNALVALYFACQDSDEKFGRVVITQLPIRLSDDKIVNTICSTYKYERTYFVTLDEILEEYGETILNFLFDLYWNCSGCMLALPKYINQRMINQAALFLVFPNELEDRFARFIYAKNKNQEYLPDFLDFPYLKNCDFAYMAKFENIEDIYNIRFKDEFEFRKENFIVSERTVNNMVEAYASKDVFLNDEYNTDKQKNIADKVVSKRYNFGESLNVIDNKSLEEQYCSILVPQECKKDILNSLKTLGIDVDFIFPELEYTAKKIKEKYGY